MSDLLDDDGQTIQCIECGRRFRALAGHLVRAHDISADAYRSQYGIARSTPLISLASRDLRVADGRRRRDEDPRVMEALTGEGARQQRAARFPTRALRPATLAASRDAARRGAQVRWAAALARAGWASWDEAGAWAMEERLGWAAVAGRMGTAQTATRRAGEAAGVRLGRALSSTSAAMLDAARAHVDAHGTLAGTSGPLARWLTSRRYAVTGGDVDQALDALDPTWRERRRA